MFFIFMLNAGILIILCISIFGLYIPLFLLLLQLKSLKPKSSKENTTPIEEDPCHYFIYAPDTASKYIVNCEGDIKKMDEKERSNSSADGF